MCDGSDFSEFLDAISRLTAPVDERTITFLCWYRDALDAAAEYAFDENRPMPQWISYTGASDV